MITIVNVPVMTDRRDVGYFIRNVIPEILYATGLVNEDRFKQFTSLLCGETKQYWDEILGGLSTLDRSNEAFEMALHLLVLSMLDEHPRDRIRDALEGGYCRDHRAIISLRRILWFARTYPEAFRVEAQ